MAKTHSRAMLTAALIALGCVGCGGGGAQQSALAQVNNGAGGQWIWMFSKDLGCPTIVSEVFPFVIPDIPTLFDVFDDQGDLSADFFDAAGNAVSMDGSFNPLTGEVSACFTVTERSPILRTGNDTAAPLYCDGKAYVAYERAFNDDAQLTGGASGILCIIDMVTGVILKDFPVGVGPRDLFASPDGRWVVVPCEFSQNLYVIDTITDSIDRILGVNDIPNMNAPTSGAFSNGKVYVSDRGQFLDSTSTGMVHVLDPTDWSQITEIAMSGLGTVDVEPDPTRNFLACINQDNSTLDFIDSATDTLVAALTALQAPPGACQGAFRPNGDYLAVGAAGSHFFSAQDLAVSLGRTNGLFQIVEVPGWDVAITPDGLSAYLTIGNKGPLVAGVVFNPIVCVDLTTLQPAQNQPDLGGTAWGIDICADGGYAMFAHQAAPYVFDTTTLLVNNNPFSGNFSGDSPLYVRLVEDAGFTPREIKIQFDGFLSLFQGQRQIDGRSQVVSSVGIQFSCQVVLDDNTWTFIDDPRETE